MKNRGTEAKRGGLGFRLKNKSLARAAGVRYNRVFRGAVNVVAQWGNYLVNSRGATLHFQHWEPASKSFESVAFYEMNMHITAFSSARRECFEESA